MLRYRGRYTRTPQLAYPNRLNVRSGSEVGPPPDTVARRAEYLTGQPMSYLARPATACIRAGST